MDDDRRKHLELIQAVVTRLAGNSFSIKGWAVALIGVLGALTAKEADPRLATALVFPLICFWGLDAYYLRQERLFRKLYQKAVAGDPRAPLFSLDTEPFQGEVDSIIRVAFSSTIRWLHLPTMIFAIALIAYSASRPPAQPCPPPPNCLPK